MKPKLKRLLFNKNLTRKVGKQKIREYLFPDLKYVSVTV